MNDKFFNKKFFFHTLSLFDYVGLYIIGNNIRMYARWKDQATSGLC